MSRRPAISPATPASNGTAVLFTVQFRHGYYNLDAEKCPDFAVVPTPDSAALMSRLGVMYRDLGDGFIVFCPSSRLPALIGSIAASGSPQDGYWSRLTFLLLLRNPAFVGITAMPLDIVPTQQTFYASNLQTKGSGSELLFAGTELEADMFHPVTGPSVTVTPTSAATITVSDISGRPVATADAAAGQAATLSLSGQPNDLYGISAAPATAYDGPPSVAFVPSTPLAWGMIDLLLTQPQPGQGNPSAFPIASPAATTSSTVQLALAFTARKTVWQYYVVSQGRHGRFDPSLAISGSGATFAQADQPVLLPTGETAILFSSTTPLPLHQHCRYRFKLTGQRHGPAGSRDDISVDRLPGAPATPVWPASTGAARSGFSEIFVYV